MSRQPPKQQCGVRSAGKRSVAKQRSTENGAASMATAGGFATEEGEGGSATAKQGSTENGAASMATAGGSATEEGEGGSATEACVECIMKRRLTLVLFCR